MFIKKDNMNFLELVKARYSCRAYAPLGEERKELDYIAPPTIVNCQFEATRRQSS